MCHVCNIMEDEKHLLVNCTTTQSFPQYFLSVCEQIKLQPTYCRFSIMSCHHFDVVYHLARLLYTAFKYRDNIYIDVLFFCNKVTNGSSGLYSQ